MMICKYCGSEIDDGSDFCYICGQKVEAEQTVYASANDNVYSQPAQSVEETVSQPVAETPIETTVQQPEIQTQPAPVQPEVETKKGKKKKKEKVKDPAVASKGIKFVAFLFAIIGLILYKKAKKAGYQEKATVILNTLMLGLCIKMAIANVILAKKYLFS